MNIKGVEFDSFYFCQVGDIMIILLITITALIVFWSYYELIFYLVHQQPLSQDEILTINIPFNGGLVSE
jgi:hypothetical protein